jgi:molybdenum cofactor cytidylyltransferase
MVTPVSALLLASGRGVRFDPSGVRSKLAATLPDGRSVLRASAQTLRSVIESVVVVVPAEHDQLLDALEGLDVRVVVNARAAEGMGTSIACGVRELANAPGWLIALADMPFVAAATLRALAESLARGASIVAPVFEGQRGHPVGFAASHFEALARLEGDVGARSILSNATVHLVEVSDSGILRDIDRPGDLF